MSQEKIDELDEKIKKIQARKRKLQARERAATRKEKSKNLQNVAGLLVVAGLVDKKTGKLNMDEAELVGALAELSQLPEHHEKRAEWQQVGTHLLSKKG